MQLTQKTTIVTVFSQQIIIKRSRDIRIDFIIVLINNHLGQFVATFNSRIRFPFAFNCPHQLNALNGDIAAGTIQMIKLLFAQMFTSWSLHTVRYPVEELQSTDLRYVTVNFKNRRFPKIEVMIFRQRRL